VADRRPDRGHAVLRHAVHPGFGWFVPSRVAKPLNPDLLVVLIVT
jgi:hypothetical protein